MLCLTFPCECKQTASNFCKPNIIKKRLLVKWTGTVLFSSYLKLFNHQKILLCSFIKMVLPDAPIFFLLYKATFSSHFKIVLTLLSSRHSNWTWCFGVPFIKSTSHERFGIFVVSAIPRTNSSLPKIEAKSSIFRWLRWK